MSLSLIKELWSKTKNQETNIDINEDQEHNKSISTSDYKFISYCHRVKGFGHKR